MADEEVTSLVDSTTVARAFRFAQSVVSDVGLKREENQDAYGFAHTDRMSFYIVADGMGGARGGGTASTLAIDTVLRNAFDSDGTINEESLRSAIELANEVIYERSRADLALSGMGTTLVALAFVGTQALIAHVGDSRIYCFRNGELLQLTRDHTLVQELVDSGAIKPEDAAHHPIAHMLTRSLGPASTVQVEVQRLDFEVQSGDRFLLCSDGMYNLVDGDELAGIFGAQPIDEAIQTLLELVLERGASDNTTIEIVEVRDINDETADFAIPEPGKIRVVTSGEVPDFEDEGEEQPEISRGESPKEEVHESIQNSAALAPLVNGSGGALVDPAEGPGSDVAEQVAGVKDDDAEEVASATEEVEPEFNSDQTTPALESVQDEDIAAAPAQTYSEELTAEVFPEYSASQDTQSEHTGSTSTVLRRRGISYKYPALAAVGLALAVFFTVLTSDPESPQVSHTSSSTNTSEQVSQSTSGSPSTTIAKMAEEAIKTAQDSPELIAHAGATGGQHAVSENVDQPTLFPNRPSLFDATGQKPLDSGSVDVAVDIDEVTGAEASSGRTDAGWPSVPVGGISTASIDSPPPLQGAAERSDEPESQDQLVVSEGPSELSLDTEQILVIAGSRSVPPAPEISPASKSSQGAAVPIDWERERRMREELKAPPAETSTQPPRILSDEEKRSVMGRKVEVRESIADLDMKLVALSARSRDELDELYRSISEQLSEAQSASEKVNGELERVKTLFQRWQERQRIALQGAFRLAPELVTVDQSVRAKKAEYDQILLQYRSAVESWQEDPQDMSRVSRMSMLAREQKAKQAELETVVQSAVDRGATQTKERLIDLMIASRDLELYTRRLARHLGFVRGVQPNVDGSNQSLIDRLSSERRRSVQEFDRLNIELSEFAENELRRDAAVLPREQ